MAVPYVLITQKSNISTEGNDNRTVISLKKYVCILLVMHEYREYHPIHVDIKGRICFLSGFMMKYQNFLQ